jgi:hypothetical protein
VGQLQERSTNRIQPLLVEVEFTGSVEPVPNGLP